MNHFKIIYFIILISGSLSASASTCLSFFIFKENNTTHLKLETSLNHLKKTHPFYFAQIQDSLSTMHPLLLAIVLGDKNEVVRLLKDSEVHKVHMPYGLPYVLRADNTVRIAHALQVAIEIKSASMIELIIKHSPPPETPYGINKYSFYYTIKDIELMLGKDHPFINGIKWKYAYKSTNKKYFIELFEYLFATHSRELLEQLLPIWPNDSIIAWININKFVPTNLEILQHMNTLAKQVALFKDGNNTHNYIAEALSLKNFQAVSLLNAHALFSSSSRDNALLETIIYYKKKYSELNKQEKLQLEELLYELRYYGANLDIRGIDLINKILQTSPEPGLMQFVVSSFPTQDLKKQVLNLHDLHPEIHTRFRKK